MTDDIAACPHSLAERETAVADGMCPICSADALSRRTPPDEIAGLIERLRRKFSFYRDPDNSARWIAHERHLDEDCTEAATALRALAQEIERLKSEVKMWHGNHVVGTGNNIALLQRIRELEAERDKAVTMADELWRAREQIRAERDEAKDDYLRRHKDVGDQMDRRIKAEAERDAIRKSERALSDAYVRLRVMIPGALDTPHAPTSEQIWNITEKALSRYAGAIRAKTIEECATVIERMPIQIYGPDSCKPATFDDAAKAIRALAQTEEKVDTSDIPEKGEEWFEKAKLVVPSQGD